MRSLAFALVFAGCAPTGSVYDPATWDDAAAVCPLVAPDGGPPVAGYGTLQPVSADCADWIGDNFEFDWESFGEEPHAFTQPITPVERTIAGLIVAFGATGVRVDEVLSEGIPVDFGDELQAYAQSNRLDDDDDAARLWFPYLYFKISDVRYTGTTEYLMAFHDGTVSVGAISPQNQDGTSGIWFDSEGAPAELAAAALVHEAAHDTYPDHVDCVDATGEVTHVDGCDESPDGAYGSGLWWLSHWITENGTRLSQHECFHDWMAWAEYCGRIYDVGDFPACSFEDDPCDAGSE